MSILFTPRRLGPLELRNRLVHSATYEAMASPSGEVTDALLARYRKLSYGGVGLIVPGHMFVDARGRAHVHQTGIHDDAREPSLVRRFQEGKAEATTCASCSQCLAAIQSERPVRCYDKTRPAAEA